MRLIRLLPLLVATLLAGPAAAPTAPALAQSSAGLGSADDPLWGRRGDLICRRWCPEDRNPCDSVQFKVADGRCDGSTRTFLGELRCRIQGETRPECPTYVGP